MAVPPQRSSSGRRWDQLVGRFAADVNGRLRDRLASDAPRLDWRTEYRVGTTPVDVAGSTESLLVAVELEWRRADPSNNVVKLFRHAAEGEVEQSEFVLCQMFTRYYDLAGAGVDSKRRNAEFIGDVAAERLDGFSYHPVTLDLDPPKRGGDPPRGLARGGRRSCAIDDGMRGTR